MPRIEPVHIAVIVLIIVVTAAFITSTVAVLTVSKKADTASVQASSARSVAVAIQAERARTIRENCVKQNQRHNDVFKVVRQLLRRPSAPQRTLTPQQRQAQIEATFRFVDALAPKANCDDLVARQAPSHTP